jgi:hypothetical protein
MAQRRDREVAELIEALERHVRLLKEYSERAFEGGESDFGGEIAGKLRLLVTRSNTNRPLLLDLMSRAGINPVVALGGPPVQPLSGKPGPGDKLTLEEYMGLDAVGIRVADEFVLLDKTQLIRLWAQQAGAAHEDWSLEPTLDAILRAGTFIGGLPAAFAELRATTETVIHVAELFMSEYHALSGDSSGSRKQG